jgi:peptidoglycan/LPS O-acetylase OafA/YrhL
MTKALTSAATGGGRFHELDALRGVAALAVVFSHCIVIILQDATLAEGLLKDALRTVKYSPLGWAVAGLPAVLLFFTLSGFVLARMLEGARIAYPGYAVKRIARIWLPYLVSVLLAMLLISTLGWPEGAHMGPWLLGVTGQPVTTQDAVLHALLIVPFEAHYNFVTWTLVHEMRISLAFPLILWSLNAWSPRRALVFYGALSVVAVGVAYVARYMGQPMVAQLVISLHFTLFFVLGALLYRHLDQVRRWYAYLSPRQRFAGLAAAALLYTYPEHVRALGGVMAGFPMLLTHWVMAPGIVLLLIWALCAKPLQRVLQWPALQWLGQVSYSLYLFHGVILVFSCHVIPQLGSPAAMALGLLVSLVFAGLAYRWVERPAQEWGRRVAGRTDARWMPT